jgi:hypothetical protein
LIQRSNSRPSSGENFHTRSRFCKTPLPSMRRSLIASRPQGECEVVHRPGKQSPGLPRKRRESRPRVHHR